MTEKIGEPIRLSVPDGELSDRQIAILRFIQRFIEQFRYAPTVREIGRALEIPSTSMINYYLTALENKGCIHRTFRSSRSIRLLEGGYQAIGQLKPEDPQAELSRLRAENRMLHERCERLQQERDRLLAASVVASAAS